MSVQDRIQIVIYRIYITKKKSENIRFVITLLVRTNSISLTFITFRNKCL